MELLTIAGRDYGDLLLSGKGLKQRLEERGAVVIETADGGLFHRYAARKRRLTVSLHMISEAELGTLEESMAADVFPVLYRMGGSDQGGMFTLDPSGVNASASMISGGVLYFTGVSFTLREV